MTPILSTRSGVGWNALLGGTPPRQESWQNATALPKKAWHRNALDRLMHTLDLTKPRQHRTRLDRLGMTRRRGLKRTSTGRRPKALPREAGCLRLRRHERMFDRITIKSVQERDSGIPGTAQR